MGKERLAMRKNINAQYGCDGKRRYPGVPSAKLAIRRLRKSGEHAVYYPCALCGSIHVGHS